MLRVLGHSARRCLGRLNGPPLTGERLSPDGQCGESWPRGSPDPGPQPLTHCMGLLEQASIISASFDAEIAESGTQF